MCGVCDDVRWCVCYLFVVVDPLVDHREGALADLLLDVQAGVVDFAVRTVRAVDTVTREHYGRLSHETLQSVGRYLLLGEVGEGDVGHEVVVADCDDRRAVGVALPAHHSQAESFTAPHAQHAPHTLEYKETTPTHTQRGGTSSQLYRHSSRPNMRGRFLPHSRQCTHGTITLVYARTSLVVSVFPPSLARVGGGCRTLRLYQSATSESAHPTASENSDRLVLPALSLSTTRRNLLINTIKNTIKNRINEMKCSGTCPGWSAERS